MQREELIEVVTNEFLSSLKLPLSFDEIKRLRGDLLEKIKDSFDEQKVLYGDKNSWRTLTRLEFYQIAKIMLTVFSIRNIDCNENDDDSDNDLLGIYVDDNVLGVLGSRYEHYRGTYITTRKVFNIIADFFSESLGRNGREEVYTYLSAHAERKGRCNDKDLIAVGNGIFNYKTKDLYDFSSEYVFLTKSRVNYNSSAQNVYITMPDSIVWDVESWFESLSDDPEVIELFWQITSALLRPNVRWNKAAMLMSNTGNNGKGTLCSMWRELCGKGTHTSIPLSDFSKDFALEPLIRSQAIIVDENDVGSYIDKAANLKAVITNDTVTINRKFKQPLSYKVKGFMVQCLNDMPKIRDKSDSFFRRQLFIPMTKCFTGIERTYIKDDYLKRKEVLEYIMKKALETNFYQLSEPDSCRLALEEYKEYNDPVRFFWNELREEFVWDLLPFPFLYDLYKSWFKQNSPSGTVLGKQTFYNELTDIVKNDTLWKCEDKSKRYKVTKTNMSKPELLIHTYGLNEWRSQYYKGHDPVKISTPDNLKEKYQGFVRIGISVTDDVEE